MKLQHILLLLLVIEMSCEKEADSQPQKKTATELLTQRTWILANHGFDDNNNEKIDPGENATEECQSDNSWKYELDGKGEFKENNISCNTGIDKQDFTWEFTNNETRIDFLWDSYKIIRLTEEEFVLAKEFPLVDGSVMRYLFTMRH